MRTYTYEIRHITDPQSNYTYDQAVYTLEIWVDNSLNVAVIVYNKDGVKVPDIAYEHSCSLLPDDPVSSEPVNSGKPGNPVYPGKPGPITGDEARTMLYIILISIAGIMALGSAIYLLTGKRRRKEHEVDEA